MTDSINKKDFPDEFSQVESSPQQAEDFNKAKTSASAFNPAKSGANSAYENSVHKNYNSRNFAQASNTANFTPYQTNSTFSPNSGKANINSSPWNNQSNFNYPNQQIRPAEHNQAAAFPGGQNFTPDKQYFSESQANPQGYYGQASENYQYAPGANTFTTGANNYKVGYSAAGNNDFDNNFYSYFSNKPDFTNTNNNKFYTPSNGQNQIYNREEQSFQSTVNMNSNTSNNSKTSNSGPSFNSEQFVDYSKQQPPYQAPYTAGTQAQFNETYSPQQANRDYRRSDYEAYGQNYTSGYNPYTQTYTAYTQNRLPSSGLAITSLVLGILSILFGFFFPFSCFSTGVAGLITGIMGNKECNAGKRSGRGMAIAGISCSAVGLFIVLLLLIITGLFTSISFFYNA